MFAGLSKWAGQVGDHESGCVEEFREAGGCCEGYVSEYV